MIVLTASRHSKMFQNAKIGHIHEKMLLAWLKFILASLVLFFTFITVLFTKFAYAIMYI